MARTFCAAAALLLGAASLTTATAADAPAAPSGMSPPGRSDEASEFAPGHADGRSWFALPALFWLPETKLGAAAVAGVHFHLRGAEEASSAFLVAGVAIEGQATADLSSDLWLASGTLLSGRLRVANYPEAFYGIGPDTKVSQREDVTRRFVEATFGAELPVPGVDERLRAGPRVQGRVEEIRDPTPGGLVATREVAGSSGFSAVGLGGSVTWDSRDEKLWPTRGVFAQAAYLYYPAAIGRNDGFGRAAVEGRAFLPLGRGRVLGFAALLEQSHGETPFSILAKLGSTRYLRGIREGRYRDNDAWAAQTELRLPLDRRFAAAVFGAAGDVAKDLGALEARTIKVAGGVGLRYKLTGEGATLRADVAMAQAGPEVYVLLLEAF
jgi:hypothetical protein